MTREELQDWLFQEGVADDLTRLSQLMVATELDNFTPSFDTDALATAIDWGRLLLAGSILSRSPSRPHTVAALRIATSALLLAETVTVKDASAILFEKLGNHRAVALGTERAFLQPGFYERLGISQRLEAEKRMLMHSKSFYRNIDNYAFKRESSTVKQAHFQEMHVTR